MAAPLSDQSALQRLGVLVRKRLADDPTAYRVPVETAEIFAVGGFLDTSECSHLIAMIDRVAKPSQVFDKENFGTYRTSYSGDVDTGDSFIRMIERRLGDLLGIPLPWGETVQGQRYQPGQEFQSHYDWFDTSAPYWPEEKRRGGQRSWTAMCYLNEVEEGGATTFDTLGISIAPQAGALLIWNNARPDGSPNPDVIHAGTPVVKGVKYIITKGFRTRPWN